MATENTSPMALHVFKDCLSSQPYLETLLKSMVARFFGEDLLAFERKEPRDEACPLTIHLEHTALSLGDW